MEHAYTIQDRLKQYSEIERFGKNTSYTLYRMLVDEDQNLLTYLRAMAIPLVSALNLICKLLTDICCILDILIQSIAERRYAGGNVLTLLVDASETCRNILGCIFGIPIALFFSPRFAANIFLTRGSEESESFLQEKESAKLYAMADRLHAFYQTHGIDYRICCGTALGAKREQGIINNDDDIDLMIHPDAVKRLTQLIDDGTFSLETGISIQKQPLTGGWQCFYEDSPKGGKGTPLEKIGFPFVDIFPGVYRHHNDKKVITYGEDKMYYQSPGDHFSEEEWGKPVLYNFGPTKLFGIQSMNTYLNRCYGPLALDYVARLYPHHVYSNIFGHPHTIFSNLYPHSSPRYFKHSHPSPQKFDTETYESKISMAKKCLSENDMESAREEQVCPSF